ncbi:HAD-superfamily hydrolase, subfamily IA, variant 1 [Companilactobacillus tucceti DSM 20183]|uniref:HAD-superfamily hydrolase, subfamily IA, variant 1 n=1 Tax=Companilactobacillus tucceti DSM 20183 TaxID=1423811 RepID=A0A0R1IZU3_9LACO|nr:HAD-IA family hydrolase [Companilactobacillus tucceti]KRK64704.1 HAD-superfamily hydrolase, subfamily IA, variant 1 [Companilactobacillus tucceti DSM 20183]
MTSIIWDFDGTLANSYPGMVAATQKALAENFKIKISKDTIYNGIKETSIRKFVADLLEKNDDTSADDLDTFYKAYTLYERQFHDQIRLMPHAKISLDYLKSKKFDQFIVTHRDQSISDIAKKLGIADYFEEMVSVSDDFNRKPDPEMLNYLIDKYKLDPKDMFVIGDRKIDIDFGKSVLAKTILLSEDEETDADYQIKSLNDLNGIL